MFPNRRTVAGLRAFIAFAAAGCAGDVPSTGPAAIPSGATLAAAAAKPSARTPYISQVQVSTVNIPTSPSDEITPFTVTVTNPGPKDALGISLEGDLLPTFNNQPPPIATAFIASCPNPTGTIPRGNCVMSNWITSGPFLTPGPGTFTLRLLQLQPDGTKKVLDTRTVEVVFVY